MTEDGTVRRGKSNTRQRTETLYARLTPDEKAAFLERADRAGMTAAAFLRAAALGDAGPRAQRRAPADKAALLQLLGELGRIGNNVNQLARAANAGLDLDAPALKEAMAAIEEMRALTRAALNRRPTDPEPDGQKSRFITNPPTQSDTPPRKGRAP